MVTVSENNNEYYEIEPDVRSALKALKDAEASGNELSVIDANIRLASAYNQTGREGKAENLANDMLAQLAELFDKGEDVGAKYCDHVCLCAAFASARSDYDKAQKIYDEALERLDMEKIAASTGANIINKLDELTPEDLGKADLVEVKKVQGEDMTFITGMNAVKSVSILIRGGTQHVIDEIERSLIDAWSVFEDQRTG